MKQPGQRVSKKLKGAREVERRLGELEREVVRLRKAAQTAAVPPGGREEEHFDYRRKRSKRGAPYNEIFSELDAPAMLPTGVSGEQITEILRLNELRFYEPGKGPAEPPGSDWWQDRRHVAGGMSEIFAWVWIATAMGVLQCGSDETKINRISRLGLWMARQDEGCENEVYNMGTCKVLIDGTAVGVRGCVGTIFKRVQVIVMRLRGLIAAAGHNPGDYTPLVDGGFLVQKLRALMHGTCNAANAAVRAIVAAKVRAGEAQFGVEAWAASRVGSRDSRRRLPQLELELELI